MKKGTKSLKLSQLQLAVRKEVNSYGVPKPSVPFKMGVEVKRGTELLYVQSCERFTRQSGKPI